jgi:subtilase family serine protease
MHKMLGSFPLLFVLLTVTSIDVLSQSRDTVRPASIYAIPSNQDTAKVVGVSPAQIRRAYGFDRVTNQGSGQTIAIVVAFDNPSVQADLELFNQTFGLPACTTTNGCLKIVGDPPPPNPALFPVELVKSWQLEAALDVQWAHAMAPQAKKVLVQADTAFLQDLLDAVDEAVLGGHDTSVVSMSWGLPETRDRRGDYQFVATNVSFFASSGDTGNPGLWPAASSDVTAVGGTKLNTNADGGYSSEHSFSAAGGGLSAFFPAATHQVPFTPDNPLGKRGIPDISYHADFNKGFAVYSSTFGTLPGWHQIGGTSGGAPQWAALVAIANSLRTASGKALLSGINPLLYQLATTAYNAVFNDIASGPMNGSNSICDPQCKSVPGYDYVTGLGSPKADVLIPALVSAP